MKKKTINNVTFSNRSRNFETSLARAPVRLISKYVSGGLCVHTAAEETTATHIFRLAIDWQRAAAAVAVAVAVAA